MAVEYRPYVSDAQMEEVTKLIEADLSEPYSIFTYRYFLNGWPQLTLLVRPILRPTAKAKQSAPLCPRWSPTEPM